jgi:hypothetical protein
VIIALCVAFCVLGWIPLWPMLFPRLHPRYVAPAVVADIPNVTYRGGLL